MKFIVLLTIAVALVSADTWAVIVSGSDGFGNYRHQSDACHAYQLHRKNGIPESNIIMFSFDDVANHTMNPFPGQLFNKPGNDSTDNYAGCKIDYSGYDNDPRVYIAVLTGDIETVKRFSEIENPKMLNSTADDLVFLSFFDHGAPGLIAFPRGYILTSIELIDALKAMHKMNMYKKLVYYMEACESGSMFLNLLPNNINIYATTAANEKESSWATYCGSDAVVKGKSIGSCLGDLYSCVWMEDADNGVKTETLKESWEAILEGTHKSHPQQFGDLTIVDDLFFSYIGSSNSPNTESPKIYGNSWDSRDATYKAYEFIAENGHSEEAKRLAAKELEAYKAHMKVADKRFLGIVQELFTPEENRYQLLTSKNNVIDESNSKCYFEAVEAYKSSCGIHEYDLKYFSTLLNICSSGKNSNEINDTIRSMC